ncbi:MAG: AAA family ATPase [Chloroflexota bacterium]
MCVSDIERCVSDIDGCVRAVSCAHGTPIGPAWSTIRSGSCSQSCPPYIVGPRAAGKTTTAERSVRTTVHLDREAEAIAFRADPDAALRGLPEPVLLDEWQLVPGVLGAVKRAVDVRPAPGRFIVTGSATGDLTGPTWPGTGRLTRIAMYGMTIRERVGSIAAPTFLDSVDDLDRLSPAAESPDLRGYVELAMRSGFPEPALRLGPVARTHWLDSYVDQLVTRDAGQLSGGRDPARLRRYLEAYAINTAGVVEDRTLYEAAGIDRRTAVAYEGLLTNLLAVEALPAWTSNRLKRLTLAPKRYVVDAGWCRRSFGSPRTRSCAVATSSAGSWTPSWWPNSGPSAWSVVPAPGLLHVRQQQGRLEVDVLAGRGGGAVVAVEVKANAAPTTSDARHLVGLRDRAGAAFVAGIVLHTGPGVYRLGERIVAAPISSLWATA